jgi:thiamine transport system substrate-binding protein
MTMHRKIILGLLCAATLSLPAAAAPKILRVLTHASFAATPAVIEAFEKANDVRIQFSTGGDAGETLNKAILAKGNPLADVLYGVDNTFMGRALRADIFEPYESPALSSVPAHLQLDATHRLLPVDFGYVTLNYDRNYFDRKSLSVPHTLEDLTREPYRGLLVVENPATSSPGLAFLLATIARFGETGRYTWENFWNDLKTNDVLVVNGWDDAYYNEFSAGGKGRHPIVVSYATSPAYEVFAAAEPKPSVPPTGNLMADGASFLQIEFVGVLKGAKEPALARRFIDFMLSTTFQEDIPLQMWVYPSNSRASIPGLFTQLAPLPARPTLIDPTAIDAKRDVWIRKWTQIVLR